jgi:hypothetical protein
LKLSGGSLGYNGTELAVVAGSLKQLEFGALDVAEPVAMPDDSCP